MKSLIICMTTELCIGIIIALLIWFKNFYYLIKYPDKYKLIKIDIQKNKPKFLNNYMYSSALIFLSLDYIFAIIKYENNIVVEQTFYNLFGDSISVRDNEEDSEILSQWTYMYSVLVTFPLFVGVFLRLFGKFIYFYNKNFISYNDVFFSAIVWLLIGFFFPTLLKDFISEIKSEWQKIKEEEEKDIKEK